jgi:hypothetical protein
LMNLTENEDLRVRDQVFKILKERGKEDFLKKKIFEK